MEMGSFELASRDVGQARGVGAVMARSTRV
jgi:hypothetical protein